MLEVLPRTQLAPLLVSPELLLAEYATYRQALGCVQDSRVYLWGARAFLRRYPDLDSWRAAPLEEQLDLHRSLKYFAHFLFLKHYLRPTLPYLLTARPQLAQAGKRSADAAIYAQFYQLGRQLGYAEDVVEGTLNLLFYVMAHAGKRAEALTAQDLEVFDQELRAFQPLPNHRFGRRTFSSHLYRVRLWLFHAGILPESTSRYRPNPARARAQLWEGIPEPLRQVVWRYLDQLSTVRAVDTVKNLEGYLRRFFGWLARTHPEVTQLRALTRAHIEEFKLWLRDASCTTGKAYHVHTIVSTLSALRCFFQTLREWDWPEVPERPLLFASDLPIRDEPLPRFLDDAQAAALLQATRAAPDLFTRVCVETLLRTGLRKGELLRLQLDSVVQIGESYWLRVPLGKLHTDRYVPLHPEVKQLLDQWATQRGHQPPTTDLFVIHGRRISLGRIDNAVRRMARAAGLEGKVSPHRLRHTLATQAVNRGMSLEAIAALLGHRSLTMTLVYARIANQTVREQYFSVCDKLDGLYAQAAFGRSSPEAQPVPSGPELGSSFGPNENERRQ